MIIGKEYHFDAAHIIAGHPKCGKIHGHTWTLTVMINGEVNWHTGFVIDFHDLNALVRPLIEYVDHTMLNETIAYRPLTCETLAIWFANRLRMDDANAIIKGKIGIRLQEGLGGWCEVWEEEFEDENR